MELQIFNSPEFGGVRVVTVDGEPRFCLSDVCKILELDASQVVKRLDGGVVTIHPITDSLGRKKGGSACTTCSSVPITCRPSKNLRRNRNGDTGGM